MNRSSDGLTWSTPFTVANAGAGDQFYKDWIVCDDTASSPFYGHCYAEWDLPSRGGLVVMSTSTDGVTWSALRRIPIDPVGSGVDHFIPGLAVNRSTTGSSAQLGLTYYYYPTAGCSSSSCQLNIGFVSSANGGASWSAPTAVAGPMSLSWLSPSSQGAMMGDYISTSFLSGLAVPVIAVAGAPGGSVLNQVMASQQLQATGGSMAAAQTVAATGTNQTPAAADPSDRDHVHMHR